MTKILVIEDERILREEIVRWLTLEDYEVLYAEDGVAGVESAFRHLPDLIVCDILMPRLDGYGVLLEVHDNPVTANIPFIFLTAKAAHDDIRQGMGMGADDYITKPFTRLELIQAIQVRLTKKNRQTQNYQDELDRLLQALTQVNDHRLFRTKLISMFSHGFANYLTSILLTNTLLRSSTNDMDPKRRLAHLNRIESSVRLLLQMLDDLAIIAQMETGNLNLESEVLNADKFFQRIQEDCQAIYGERHTILMESQRNDLVWVDMRLLRLITTNLLTYITQSSRRGSTVRVMLDNFAQVCSLTIQVQNANMSETGCKHISDALQQSSNIENVFSIGLELAVVKQAVALHCGSIHFNSQSNMITVTLPTQPYENVMDEVVLVG